MVDLPSYRPLGITAEAPTPGITPGAIAARGSWLSDGLKKFGTGLEDVSVPLAEEAGRQAAEKAVTRNPDGSISVAQPGSSFILGRAGDAYARSAQAATLVEAQSAAQSDIAEIRRKYAGNPQEFEKQAGIYADSFSGKFHGELQPAIKGMVDHLASQHYVSMVDQQAHLDLTRQEGVIDTGLKSTRNDLTVLAFKGVTGGPQWDASMNQYRALTQARVDNPRLGYTQTQADYDINQFTDELQANGFLHHVNEKINDQGVNPDGSARGGVKAAREFAQSILSDTSIHLAPEKRQQFYIRAIGEITASEAIRKQDVEQARFALKDFESSIALGYPADPERVEGIAKLLKSAGDLGSVARLYQVMAHKPLGDQYGQQPLPEMTAQLTGMTALATVRSTQAANTAYSYFKSQGFSDAAAAGMVGNGLHESGMNPAQSHDNGTGIGIFGWRGERRAALQAFAASRGTTETDLDTQLAFTMKELNTTEGRAMEGLRGAKSASEGAAQFIHFERPLGYNADNVTASYGFGSRVGLARAVAVVHGADPKSANDFIGTPGGMLWLQMNRQTELDKKATATWDGAMKEWTSKDVRPADSVVSEAIDAARATNNDVLLGRITQDLRAIDGEQSIGRQPLADQDAVIGKLSAGRQAGEFMPGDQTALDVLKRRRDAVVTGYRDNPVSTAVGLFHEWLEQPAALNLTDPAALREGLARRSAIVSFAQQKQKIGPLSVLDQSDLQTVTAALDTPDVGVKLQIFGALSQLPQDQRNATLAKIGKERPDLMVSAAAGSMMRQAPDVAQSILRGQQALKVTSGDGPNAKSIYAAKADDFETEFDKQLPPNTFSLAARTTDNGPYEVAKGMVKARYADISARMNDSSGEIKTERLKQAVNDVTGGVLHHNGGGFIAPRRGMSQTDFDNTIYGLTDSDLAGVTTLSGRRVDAAYLLNSAQLESAGDGRYLVRLGNDPMRPTYAYQNADTEAPTKFVLDLRNRPMGTVPFKAPDYTPGG